MVCARSICNPATAIARSTACARPAPRWRSDPSALALRAEVGVAPRDLHGLDRRPAATARQPRPPVDLELVLKLPGLAEQVKVRLVVQRRPPEADRILQDLLH